jgi:hypothetical protein
MLWMLGQDLSFSFVRFERLFTKHVPAQNKLWALLVISQSLYETKREKLIAVFAFNDK